MKKVLVIDDDQHHIDLCRMLIGHHFPGMGVISLTRTGEAYNTIIMERPCCIVLDNMIPGGSGLALLHELKECMKDCPPVIFLSCAMTYDLSANGLALDAVICMSKLDAMAGALVDAIESITGEKRKE